MTVSEEKYNTNAGTYYADETNKINTLSSSDSFGGSS
ncbi:MAG: hypothetical protein ACD_79C01379G0006, partial [uncultured bacterium]